MSEEERNATYERKWQEGGSISFLYSYTDLLTNKAANDTAADFVRNKIRQIVKDPETAEALCPNDHPIGTKRLILDTNYYQTYNLPHVKLVNIRKNPIEEITEWGIKTSDGKAYEIDAIVFATGFDAMTGAMKEIDIKGKGGLSIDEKWKDGPQTYLGVMVAGFPNMFMITGPQSPGVKSQMIFSCQQHVDFIGDIITYARGRQMRRIEASRMAEMAWVQHNNEVAQLDALSAGQQLVHGRQHPRQAARIHALRRRRPEVRGQVQRDCRQRLRRLRDERLSVPPTLLVRAVS